MSFETITSDMTIENLVQLYPVSVKFLMEKGIRCMRCGEPIWGSIGEAAIEKGYSHDALPELIEELKRYLHEKDE